ncbi:MAG: phosphotransferase [Chloroflexota bacterium]|nr:phosphotransferase [Chloroflexota bacterium]
MRKELEPLDNRVRRLNSTHPSLGLQARRCLALAEQRSTRFTHWRWHPVHRDFYHDQILATERDLSVLDFDDAAMSEPTVDVANFLAHLRLLSLQHGHSPGPDRVAASFEERYRRLDPDLDPCLLRFLEGTTLLRLAEIHLPRSGGEHLARRLLQESERLLRSDH